MFFLSQIQAQLPGCTNNIFPADLSVNAEPYPYITLKWNAVSGATSYDVYVNSKLPPTQLIGTVSVDSFNFINATYNTKYFWYVVPKGADGSAIGCASSVTSFVSGPPPQAPANDNCDGAIDLSATPVTGSTLGATQSMPATECNGYTGTANDDVWYQFTATANESLIISLTGNQFFDGVLEAFSGNCGSLVSLTCSDSSQVGGTERITLDVTAGTDYKIRIYNFYADLSHRGTFKVLRVNAPLPVTLVNFKAERLSEKNHLWWSTSSEINNKGFDIQYSADGTNFTSLFFVSSKAINGNSSSLLSYEYTDERALPGNSYYRLKQVDKNGISVFSKIILLKGTKMTSFSLGNIYPNPARNELHVNLASPESDRIKIEISDITGKRMLQLTTQGNSNSNYPVDISGLPSGSYFIKAIDSNGSSTSVGKFVKE